ncbi:HAD family phosphatase [Jiangella ureilytica]|uniref:HAD family phosphatase n=1 Tax=Jiangella ureilytica TaxID=2530374 RepID=A0A4R4RYF5_9ACTN|nr:HAD family phosphatase [Jiangella ureilytica]TDC53723.1 HAD family phosphatase [Jiangella ureilytica]
MGPVSGGLDPQLAGRRAALIDLDGTLVDSEPANQAAYRSYFTTRGWEVGPDVYRQFAGRRGADVFAQLPGPWTGEDAAALVEGVLAHVDHDAHPLRPLAGAAELIRRLHAAGVAIALVTSAKLSWAEYAVGDVLGVRDCFTALITWETVGAGKPDPAPYLAGADAVGAPPADAVALEDTVPGLRSALAAGVGLVIGVASGADRGTLLDGGAHRVVAGPGDLLKS